MSSRAISDAEFPSFLFLAESQPLDVVDENGGNAIEGNETPQPETTVPQPAVYITWTVPYLFLIGDVAFYVVCSEVL